ncbi:MAG TPA: TrmH family RNA methyltransferase [Patescibacteria group bacterium]|nr:TrmH family RNA methyltransferase [Patescibacteria group bacterium]
MTDLQLIANDIRSRENVGSLFRTCDSLGVRKLWLTGYTPAPPDPKISKVALGAETAVVFEKYSDVMIVITALKKEQIPVFALELSADAIELSQFNPPSRMALLLGTETTGIPPSLLSHCDGAIKITQKGIKESMNVSVAAGIAAWAILSH